MFTLFTIVSCFEKNVKDFFCFLSKGFRYKAKKEATVTESNGCYIEKRNYLVIIFFPRIGDVRSRR